MFNKHSFPDRMRNFWFLVCSVLIVCLLVSGCIPNKAKTYRVGVLSGLNYVAQITDGFKEQMSALGYIEGENIVYDVQKTDFDIETYQRVLRKFIIEKVDLIFVFPTEATIEAKKETQETKIPVIFNFVLIEDMDLVKSVREPGGNITGVRFPGPDIALKRYEVMMEIIPQAKRLLVPYQKDYPIVASQLAEVKPAAAANGVTLIELPANNAAELESALQKQIGSSKVDGILLLAEPLTVTEDAFLVLAKFSYEYKIPMGGAIFSKDGYGSLFGVNVNLIESGKQAAPLADKIFKGTSPAIIPVVSAESYLQVNNKVAQDLGIKIPESVLKQANEVIH